MVLLVVERVGNQRDGVVVMVGAGRESKAFMKARQMGPRNLVVVLVMMGRNLRHATGYRHSQGLWLKQCLHSPQGWV